jgi:hypothetical protein
MTSEATVPEAAIHAALREWTIGLEVSEMDMDQLRDPMRAALTAALPHLSTAIRDAALRWRTDVEDGAYGCHVEVARWDEDVGEWIVGIVLAPPGKPWTHWRHLRPMPDAIPAPAEGNEAEGAKPIGYVNSRAIADNRHGASAVMSFTNGAGFVIPVYAGPPPSAALAHAPGELVERARKEIKHFLSDRASGYVNGISKEHLKNWLAALSQEQRGAVEISEWKSAPDILLDEIAVIRDEYRKRKQDALDQMEWHASQGDPEETSDFSTEAERHGAALLACNRILGLVEKFEHVRNSDELPSTAVAPVHQESGE